MELLKSLEDVANQVVESSHPEFWLSQAKEKVAVNYVNQMRSHFHGIVDKFKWSIIHRNDMSFWGHIISKMLIVTISEDKTLIPVR